MKVPIEFLVVLVIAVGVVVPGEVHVVAAAVVVAVVVRGAFDVRELDVRPAVLVLAQDQLLRHPEDITLAQVVEAIEGPIALTACVEGAVDPCSVQNGCFMSGNWSRVNKAIHLALSEVSLAELFNPCL